jgi:hypothetical protein
MKRAFSAGIFAWLYPGALPQAVNDAAPLALDTYSRQARLSAKGALSY